MLVTELSVYMTLCALLAVYARYSAILGIMYVNSITVACRMCAEFHEFFSLYNDLQFYLMKL